MRLLPDFLSTSPRARIAYVHDVVMSGLSFLLSLYLRVGGSWAEHVASQTVMTGTVVFTLMAAAVFLYQPMYKGIWRYASMRDLVAITKAVTLTILLFVPAMFLTGRLEDLPRSAFLINWFVLMALLGGPRFVYRIFKDRRLDFHFEARRDPNAIPILLVGAGDAAEQFLRSLHRQPGASYRVVGIVTRKKSRVGRHIHGVEILSTVDDVEDAVGTLSGRNLRPMKLVLTDEAFAGEEVKRLLDTCDRLGLTLARLPRPTDLRDGTADRLDVRPVSVEDLLGRPQAVLDREAIAALIAGRRVLVTGAGGSIGAELARQVAALGPASLTLFDSSEFALYAIDLEVAEQQPDLPRVAALGSVRERGRLDAVMAAARPDVVFHAAALKHVPMVEMNPVEGIWTNAVGSRHVADACRAHGVATLVMISTDKAVNPTNIMGAGKRAAESYCQALDILDQDRPRRTRFITVRFGNVLGSTGSVVPLFQRQLARGGPLTVTDPKMTRYFMTIREAVELVFQAAALGTAADNYRGRIFVLDMGEPVRIADLARQMIRLAGLRPDQDIDIVYTQPRPGEKLFEEIFHGAERPLPTEREGVLIADPRRQDHARVAALMDALEAACRDGDARAALERLRDLVPEYTGT
ncbi:polysaccharide biosynthesis protein [Rhodospira trueperi]|uniref:O-antigen biosynthesis protein WbqV n=1 Tax=Rhodospira trueperi TaxID=69960 RepID=A0A1G7EKV5_9PROT|nr:nucleoside-diphosphate sugar epimerase/dehydratase [Rhodospira trueperi]SDE64217.1 O-antigen biosynthesis protein WbqV [Rhodospira trueperi]